jgi:hypothetical protein
MTSADLIAELQAARPAAGDDLRARVRAIASAPPAPRRDPLARLRHLADRRTILIALPAAAVLLLAIAGVGGLFDSGGQMVQPPLAREGVASSAAGSAPSPKLGAPATDTTTPAPTPGRAQRYSAQLTLSVKDVAALSDATQQALRITRDLGGHLVNVSYATSDTGVSTLTLKVPTGNVQDAIVRLTGLGTIVSQQVQIDDLQGQVDDLTRQETVLLERIARLSARIAQPGIDAQTKATLEARRDAARAELARVRTARAQVRAEASEATIQLTLQTEQSSTVPVAPSRWDRTLDRGGEILALEAEILVTTLVLLGPIALVALLAWLGRRTLRRRESERLLSSP